MCWWLLGTLLILELGIRTFDPLGASYLDDLEGYFQPMALHYVVAYRHQANAHIKLHNWSLVTNADGLRGPELPSRKDPGVFRVLLLGDSVALGWGVPFEQTVGALLGPLLSAKRGAPVEVVLDATASWNTVFEVRDLYVRFARFDPDLVILLYVDNDFEVIRDLGPEWHGRVGSILKIPSAGRLRSIGCCQEHPSLTRDRTSPPWSFAAASAAGCRPQAARGLTP